jgi:hypothetical protein
VSLIAENQKSIIAAISCLKRHGAAILHKLEIDVAKIWLLYCDHNSYIFVTRYIDQENDVENCDKGLDVSCYPPKSRKVYGKD